MAETVFTARCGDQSWSINLNPRGAVIGRGTGCDVVIDRMEISRRHVRAFCDPAGRWVFEDLGSSNGLFLNGARVEACTVGPGDVLAIGPVLLSLGRTQAEQTPSPATPSSPHIIVQDFGMEVFYDKPRLADCPKPPCPDRIGPMRERLSQPTDSPARYAEACRILTERPRTVAAVFQMRTPNDAPSKMPSVLVHHISDAPADSRADGWNRSCQALRISHRLLEAVRTGNKPLMTKTVFTCDTQVTVSLIDEFSPRAIACVPLTRTEQTADLLYVDFPIEEPPGPSPEEFFAFVQAVAEQITRWPP